MPPYKLLEGKWSKFVGSKYSIATNTGTSALHLAFLTIGLKPKDEVIMCDFAMAACAFAVSYCGAKPVFVDCGDDLNIDIKHIIEKITDRTKAILAIHTYGRLCNMKEILRIAKKYHLKVIEDACEAQGAVYKSKADITCYSFYENKIIHAEEGGICTTDNKKYADRINYLKNMAFGEKHDYFHKEIGYNYRMPNSQAKQALKSLKNYPKENKRRRKIEKKYYGENIHDAVWVLDFVPPKGDGEISFLNYIPLEKNVREFFKPLSSFPMYGGKCKSPNALYYSKFGYYIRI